jgi:hypothetical protein
MHFQNVLFQMFQHFYPNLNCYKRSILHEEEEMHNIPCIAEDGNDNDAPKTSVVNENKGNEHHSTLAEGEKSFVMLDVFHQSCYYRVAFSGTLSWFTFVRS